MAWKQPSPKPRRKSGKALFYLALSLMMIETAPALPAHDAAPVAAKPAPAVLPEAPVPALGAPVRIAPRPRPAPAKPGAFTLDFPLHRELPIRQWLKPGEYAWDDEGVAPGPVTIVVNIRARTLSAYRAGAEIGRSSLIYGANEKPTPYGEFRIMEKDADHKSRTYGNAPMPFAMRLTGDGVFLHGSAMADDLATHGCVGLPKDFARLLFGAAKVGDRVVIWKGMARA